MNNLQYYRDEIVNNISKIEEITQIMVANSHPGLEVKFWAASDAKDLNALKFIKNQTDKIIDGLNEGNKNVL